MLFTRGFSAYYLVGFLRELAGGVMPVKYAGRLCTIVLLLLNHFLIAQQKDGEITDQKFYANGKLKAVTISHGNDIVEYRNYYKNGQIKDSVWLKIDGNDEVPIGTSKSYYKNGRLASKKVYGKEPNECTTWEYSSHGVLKYFEQRPTGLTKYYNKRGRQVREYDLNKMTFVRVPKRYRNGRHLSSTRFEQAIKAKTATLVNQNRKVPMYSGVLISLVTTKDTSLLTHCQVEGFSGDSIYLSKFQYSKTYDRTYDFDVLEYRKTFAVGFNQLSTIYYTRYNNSRRRFFARTFFTLGFGTLLVPIAFVPGTAKAINDGEADYQAFSTAYGSAIAAGFTMIAISRQLYKTTVPKKYDMRTWKLVP